MANTKKFSKTTKNTFKNKNKTKNNKSRKLTTFLRKGKNNSLKKNKLMKGGEKKVNDTISIDKNEYKCTKPSSYVIELNKVFLDFSNIKYRKKIKQIACEFVNTKIPYTKQNNEKYKNMIDDNFVVFMCYFFDDTENKYINFKQCDPNFNYYNNAEINYIVTNKKCLKGEIYVNIEPKQNTIYAIPNKEDLKEINQTWVEFLNTKLIEENITKIRDIIITTLKKYIEKKLQEIDKINVVKQIYEKNTLIDNIILSQQNLDIIFGKKNTAIEFILFFCNKQEQNEIKTILINNLDLHIYANLLKTPN